MERITQKHLEVLLARINTVKGFGSNPPYSTVGSYTLDWAYGGVKLEMYVSTGGGVQSITEGFDTKRATYDKMRAFLAGLGS